MNKQVAQALIDSWIEELRKRSYGDLVLLMGDPQTREVTGSDGKAYQLEAQVFWDGNKGGNLRVMVSGDDGGWRAFILLTSDFIMAPDNSFVGE